jgi:hypothetical protein
MSRRLDALDHLIMSFEHDDPVEQVKEAMLAGNTKEASRLVDGLSIEQLEKLAETLSELGPSTSTDEYTTTLESSADPEPKDKDTMVSDSALPENTTGDERVNNTSEGVGVDDPSVKAAGLKKVINTFNKKAEGEVGGESSGDGGPADTVSSTSTETTVNPSPEGEDGNNPDLGDEDIDKTAAKHVRVGIRRALQKVATVSVLNSGISAKNPYFNRSVSRKIEELAIALSKNL